MQVYMYVIVFQQCFLFYRRSLCMFIITSHWEVSWATPNWRYRCPAWAHLLAECPIQNPVFLLPVLFGDYLAKKNKQDVFAGRSKEKVKRIVLCCTLLSCMISIEFIFVWCSSEPLIFKVRLFRELKVKPAKTTILLCSRPEWRFGRACPSCETPLGPGAKKESCLRRLKMVGLAFRSELEWHFWVNIAILYWILRSEHKTSYCNTYQNL